jgi:hypothetical protein
MGLVAAFRRTAGALAHHSKHFLKALIGSSRLDELTLTFCTARIDPLLQFHRFFFR